MRTAYGRIKRGRTRVQAAYLKSARGSFIHRTAGVQIRIGRYHGGYTAQACVNGRDSRVRSCARVAQARSPQSAFAKSLRYLAHKVARRGR